MVRTEFTAEKILEGAREIFAAKGFDASSMQELAKGVGMSVGNFYRYFPSKAAIIVALARHDLKTIEAEFESIVQAKDSKTAFQDVLRQNIANTTVTEAAIWMEIETVAARTPEIAQELQVLEEVIEAQLIKAFSYAFSIPLDEAKDAFGNQAKLVMNLVHSIQKSRVRGPISPELIEACVNLIDLIFVTSAQSYAKTKSTKGS